MGFIPITRISFLVRQVLILWVSKLVAKFTRIAPCLKKVSSFSIKRQISSGGIANKIISAFSKRYRILPKSAFNILAICLAFPKKESDNKREQWGASLFARALPKRPVPIMP